MAEKVKNKVPTEVEIVDWASRKPWAPKVGKNDNIITGKRVADLEKQARMTYDFKVKLTKLTADVDYLRKHMKVIEDLVIGLYNELKRRK